MALDTGAIDSAIMRTITENLPFPQYLKLAAAAGVESYEVNVSTHVVFLCGPGGVYSPPIAGMIPDAEVAEAFNAVAVKEAVAKVQAGKSTYLGFLTKIAAAGVETYVVVIPRGVVVYRGRGEHHLEFFPV